MSLKTIIAMLFYDLFCFDLSSMLNEFLNNKQHLTRLTRLTRFSFL